MKVIRSFLLVAFICQLVACAGITGTDPKSLSKSERHEEISLAQGISTLSYRGLNYRWEEGALPGLYKAEREDARGVYYFGQDRSIWMTNDAFQKKPRLHVGGIFLPHDKAKGPQFFYFFETDVTTTHNIDAYMQSRMATTGSLPDGTPGAPAGGIAANAVGNAVASAVVAGLLEINVGRIEMYPPIEDAKLRQTILDSIRTSKNTASD